MFKESQKYRKESIEEAIYKLNSFDANMGGTELYPVLKRSL